MNRDKERKEMMEKTKDSFDMIVVDIDETLFWFNSKESVFTPGAQEMIERIAADKHVVVLTGRILGSALRIARECNIPEKRLLIGANNGSVIYSGSAGKIVFEERITKKEIDSVIASVREAGVGVVFITSREDMIVYGLEDIADDIDDCSPSFEHDYVAASDETIRNAPIIGGNTWGNKKQIDRLQELLSERTDLELTRSDPHALQFSHGNKMTALLRIVKLVGVAPERVLGFGDGPNDKCWFERFPYCVAMKNAVPELKQVAWKETLSAEDGGVAVFLEKLGF